MLQTLRSRLILSHILPMLVITPLMGIALIYVLESQFILPSLTRALTGEAILLSQLTQEQSLVWHDSDYAQSVLRQGNPNLRTRVMLISPEGRLIASSDPADKSQQGQPINTPGIEEALQGEISTRSNYYNPAIKAEVIEVVAPVLDRDQKLLGLVRLTYEYATVSEEFNQLRYLIAGILVIGLVGGATLGYFLALNINIPLQRVTKAVYDLAQGNQREPLVEHGPVELRLLLHAVNVLVDRLHHLETARKQLLANLVHELGRPLGALRSAIQALMMGASDDIQMREELLTGMDGEAQRLQLLLDDLAHLHDQVLGTLELNRQPLELSKWLPSILYTWQAAAAEKRIRWEQEFPPNLPTIHADPTRLAQALGNLTSNAIKFTPVGGSVFISAGVKDERVWISVRDTGPGIAPGEQEKIFTPYYRGSHGRRFPQGMGLGLTITRDLVSAHGGTLELQSTPGIGSQFTIWLPVNRSEPTRTP